VLGIEHDHAVARHRGVPLQKELLFDLSTPLWREEEIRRVVSSRLERTRLEAPSVGLRLEAPAVIRSLGRQLDLSRVSGGITGEKGLESLPVLLAELGADIGKDRLGVLALADAHRPEKKSELRPALAEPEGRSRGKKKKKRDPLLPLRKVRVASGPVLGAPSRFLPQPLPIDVALRVGATLRIDHRLYSIERITFVERLELVEWWTGNPVARDYLWLLLRATDGVLEAMVYVDRDSGKRFLQAVAD
jgi:protein ImuB